MHQGELSRRFGMPWLGIRLHNAMLLATLLIAARACDSFISLRGVVLDTDRKPVQGALVTVTWRGHSTSTLSDSVGHFNVHMPIPWFFDSDSSHLDACKPGVGYGGQSFPLNYSSKVELTLAPAGPHSSHGECHEAVSEGNAPRTCGTVALRHHLGEVARKLAECEEMTFL